MDEKNDLRDLADECGRGLSYMQALLLAADDQVQFYLSNKSFLGPYWELLHHHAAQLGILLTMTRDVLEQTDGKLERLSRGLYTMQPQAAG